MQTSVVRLDGSQVVTRRISNHYPRISRSSRIIRTSQVGESQPSVLNGKESLLFESKIIESRPVTRVEVDGSRVISSHISENRLDGAKVTTISTNGYTKRYDDGYWANDGIYRSYTRPSRTYVKEESIAQDGSKVVRFSRYGESQIAETNTNTDGSRVVRYSRHGLVDGDRVIRYSRHGLVDGERVIRTSRHGLLDGSRVIRTSRHGVVEGERVVRTSRHGLDGSRIIRYSRHGLVDGERVIRTSRHGLVDGERVVRYSRHGVTDGDRVIRYSSHARPSRSYVLDNGVTVIRRDDVVTNRVTPVIETTVETKEPVVYRTSRSSRSSRSFRRTLPGSIIGSRNKFSLDNWNTYRSFLNDTKTYTSVLNNDNLFSSQREVKYIDADRSKVIRYENNDNFVTRTVIDANGNRVVRTSRVIKADDPYVTRIVA
jgi:hypothetical protein